MYLKEFREKIGLTQKELSEKIDVAQTTIARYEKQQINPTSVIIYKYINILNANPNFLFLKMEPHTLFDFPNLSEQTFNSLKDTLLLFSEQELQLKLNKILIDEIVKRFFSVSSENIFSKILSFVKLEGIFESRPILFLYYIFQIIDKDLSSNERKITSYRDYLKRVISEYRVLSWSNQPIFTDQMKESVNDTLDVKLTEEDCRIIINNYKITLEVLESNMPPHLIKYHKNIFNWF